MMLSQTAEHALRAVLHLAGQPVGTRVPAEAIARALDAPRNYLSKTLAALAREGLITSVRGPHGGFRLEVPASELTVARVVSAFDEAPRRGVCLAGGRRCSGEDPCRTHVVWSDMKAAARAPLERTTIADLLNP